MTKEYIQAAREAYSVEHWSSGYFDINGQGQVDVGYPGVEGRIPLNDIVQTARERGLALPLLIRFGGILRDRVTGLCQSFKTAMDKLDYPARFTAVYPIKVNQQHRVVEEILNAPVKDSRLGVGLEVGSKPELLAVLGMGQQDSVIVCNGYKDAEYVRLALIGKKMGRQVYLVVEKLTELSLIFQQASAMGVTPSLGLRIRLSSVGKGNWQNTGGEKSKFGLSASQVIHVVDRLRESGHLDYLRLLHFHLGSQISNIKDIQIAMKEAARYFAELTQAGAPVECVDVGGGLGVDYEGTRSRSFCSMNYSIDEYAQNIVQAMKEVCDREQLACPDLITESGRALTAHHAVLVSNIIGYEAVPDSAPDAVTDGGPVVLKELWRCYQYALEPCGLKSLTELYHDVTYRLIEAHEMYTHGVLSLREKSTAEEIYYAACHCLLKALDITKPAEQEVFLELNEKLADKVFLNFSLFQSIPDAWGIGQVFPIMPTSQLDQALDRRGIVQDITCDSDGRVDNYVDSSALSASLPMPERPVDGDMSLAIFMVGAYQEILGDMHNLFGDTDSVDVEIGVDGNFSLSDAMKGDTVDQLLKYVNFDTTLLLQRIHGQLMQVNLTTKEQSEYLSELRKGLMGGTYLE